MAKALIRKSVRISSLRGPGSPVTAESMPRRRHRGDRGCAAFRPRQHVSQPGTASVSDVGGRWLYDAMSCSAIDSPAAERGPSTSRRLTTWPPYASTMNLPTPGGRGWPLSKRRGLSQPAPANGRIVLPVRPGPAATVWWPLLSDATTARLTPEQTRLLSGRHGTSRKPRHTRFGDCMTHLGSTLGVLLCYRESSQGGTDRFDRERTGPGPGTAVSTQASAWGRAGTRSAT
jgi:hypothetical protein